MEIKEAAKDVDVRPSAEGFTDLALALDLLGSIDSAEATLRCAIERRESRGSHQRSDFTELSKDHDVNYVIKLESGNQVVSKHQVEPLPADLEQAMNDYQELNVDGRLLE